MDLKKGIVESLTSETTLKLAVKEDLEQEHKLKHKKEFIELIKKDLRQAIVDADSKVYEITPSSASAAIDVEKSLRGEISLHYSYGVKDTRDSFEKLNLLSTSIRYNMGLKKLNDPYKKNVGRQTVNKEIGSRAKKIMQTPAACQDFFLPENQDYENMKDTKNHYFEVRLNVTRTSLTAKIVLSGDLI